MTCRSTWSPTSSTARAASLLMPARAPSAVSARGDRWLDRAPIPGETAYDRMLYVLGRVTRSMQREPLLTEAMTRAFMFADPSAAAEVNTVAKMMEDMLTKAMHDGEPTAD